MVELWTVYAIKNQRISGDLHILINKIYDLGLAIGFDLDTHFEVGWFVALFAYISLLTELTQSSVRN